MIDSMNSKCAVRSSFDCIYSLLRQVGNLVSGYADRGIWQPPNAFQAVQAGDTGMLMAGDIVYRTVFAGLSKGGVKLLAAKTVSGDIHASPRLGGRNVPWRRATLIPTYRLKKKAVYG